MTVAMPFASKKRKARCIAVWEPENAMKRRKALLSEEELLLTKERDKVHKASKRASETREQTLQARTEPNTSSLRRGFCTSVLFIYAVLQSSLKGDRTAELLETSSSNCTVVNMVNELDNLIQSAVT